jgi:membrane protease YdiL (CAAX protease family)
VIWGAAIGLSFSIPIVTAVLRLPVLFRLREHSIARSRMFDLRSFNPIWISLFAGVGEEILFRGAIQPLRGLWLTSAIFCLLHIEPNQYRSISPNFDNACARSS